ncbi:hypothetical protein [Chitinophaga sp. HK235]|uniref:hypothetical protein n=1 Tax=Chitinophaga sp. HK235 TaxID=2952571 RepID=UPI001BABA045|nr:hypothetical protein [Chitinophaga sp. HK235]
MEITAVVREERGCLALPDEPRHHTVLMCHTDMAGTDHALPLNFFSPSSFGNYPVASENSVFKNPRTAPLTIQGLLALAVIHPLGPQEKSGTTVFGMRDRSTLLPRLRYQQEKLVLIKSQS